MGEFDGKAEVEDEEVEEEEEGEDEAAEVEGALALEPKSSGPAELEGGWTQKDGIRETFGGGWRRPLYLP